MLGGAHDTAQASASLRLLLRHGADASAQGGDNCETRGGYSVGLSH